MNRLEKAVDKVSGYPKWVLSWVIGRTVPYVGTSGVHFEKMTKDQVIVSLKNKKKVRNHIHQIHAAAMMLLAETASGMALGMNIPDDRIPLVKTLNTAFVKRSTGAMKAVAVFTDAQRDLLANNEKGETPIQVIVTDETGIEPIICEVVWAWIPKKKKT